MLVINKMVCMGRTIYVLSGLFMSMHKRSGRTKYDDISGSPDYLCCHKWSLWTIYSQTINFVTIHSLVVCMADIFFQKFHEIQLIGCISI